VAQPVEAVGWAMEHQPPQALHGLEREGTQAVATVGILGAAGDLAVLQGDEPVVRDGHAMRRAGQGLQDGPGGLAGLCRVAPPLLVAQRGEEVPPGWGLGTLPPAPCHGQGALAIEVLQPREGEAPEAPREDADGQEEVRPTRHPLGAIWR